MFYEYNYDNYTPVKTYLNIIEKLIEKCTVPWRAQVDGVWTHVVPEAESHFLLSHGWKIHISANLENAEDILSVVAAALIERSTQFKFANDPDTLRLLTSKRWSRGASGKFITIYPSSVEDFRQIIENLYKIIGHHRGSYILSDRRYKDSKCIYYRYGSIKSTKVTDILGRKVEVIYAPDGTLYVDKRNPFYSTPPWVVEVFNRKEDEEPDGEQITLCAGRFEILEALSFSNTGGVYLAYDNRRNVQVVIKEARPGVELGQCGEDAKSRLRHEAQILRSMEGSGITPRLVTTFDDWENFFLVEEFVDGLNIRQVMLDYSPLLKSQEQYRDSLYFFNIFKKVFISLLRAVQEFHSRGIVIGDLSPTNIFVSMETKEVTIIDLEGAFAQSSGVRQEIHTPGFRPSAERVQQESIADDDIYAVGVIMIYSMFPVAAMALLRKDVLDRVLPVLIDDLGWGHTGVDSIIIGLLGKKISCSKAAAALNSIELVSPKALVPSSSELTFSEPEICRKLADFLRNSFRLGRARTAFPIDPFGKSTNASSLFFGTSGVMWSLHRSGEEIPKKIWERYADEVSPARFTALPDGIATGIAGVAFSLLEMGRLDLAKPFLDGLLDRSIERKHHSLYYGISGIGMVMILAWKLTGNKSYIDRAVQIGVLLNADAFYDDKGAYWKDAGGIRIGLGYGQSGVAIFLLRLSQITGEMKWRDLGVRAVQYDLSHGVELHSGVVGFPGQVNSGLGENTFFPYIEQGSAGVAKAALRLGMVDQTRKLMPAISRKYSAHPGLIFGLTGLIDVLVDLERYTGDKYYRTLAALPLAGLRDIYLFETPLGMAVPGDNLFRVSCDYATGVAGVMATLDRFSNLSGDRLLLDWLDDEPLPLDRVLP